MRKYLRKITRIFAMEWETVLQYRTDLILWTLVGTVEIFIPMALWYTISLHNTHGPASSEVATYYIVLAIVFQVVLAWHSMTISTEILDGSIVRLLIRPVTLAWYYIGNNLTEKVIKISLIAAVLGAVFALYPHVLTTGLREIHQIKLFWISLLLSIIIAFALDTIMGAMAFWFEDAQEIMRFNFLLWSIASGVLIPYAFMPHTLATILSVLPFRYMFSAPVELLLGQVSGIAAVTTLVIQTAWAVGLIFLLRIIWTRGLRRYAVPGQ